MPLVFIDFETLPIGERPHEYPPKPVGVAIKYADQPAEYLHWGHPDSNPDNFHAAQQALKTAWESDRIVFHNAKFDIDVAVTHMGMETPPWNKVHDTMLLLFLDNPNEKELGLKKSSERLLNMLPDEQDAVADWLIENPPFKGVKISRSKSSKNFAGKYTAYAPAELVGEYAKGDVVRTEALFNLLYPRISELGMMKAYDREVELMLNLLEMERRGVQVDLPRLRSDVALYTEWLDKITAWVQQRLNSPTLNVDSGADLASAMLAAGVADAGLLGTTPTGKVATNKTAISRGVTDKVLISVLKYRAQLSTCLGTFMLPWLKTAEQSGGLIYTTWYQTKSNESKLSGTRTGRLSSSPNFQNMPKQFAPLFAHEGEGLPPHPFDSTPPSLPLIRGYVIPYHGQVLIDRDYAQQEPRILAHFGDGELMQHYNSDPWLDLYDKVTAILCEKQGLTYKRKEVKIVVLGLIYGKGVTLLASELGTSLEEAQQLKEIILNLFPELRALTKMMKQREHTSTPIRTWGGRLYYCEKVFLNGNLMSFGYKLVNTLIQGSAADCTKEAINRVHRYIHAHMRDWYVVLNVHDEIVMSVPPHEAVAAMEILRQCMEGIEFDVPMLSEGSMSSTTWAQLIDYDKKGVLCQTM